MKIYQLETTNYCNAKCSYCPHQEMTRPKGYVSPEIVRAVAKYCWENNQKYIALHHMGEPLLHVRLPDIIKIFNENGVKSEFSTNGMLLPEFGQQVLEAKPKLIRIAIDYFYNKENYINNINKFLDLISSYPETNVRIHTIMGNNLDVFKSSNSVIHENKILDNWASQTLLQSDMLDSPNCYFLDYQYCVVLWDGTIVPCCLDYNGNYPIGHINNINNIIQNKSFELCKSCKKLQFAEGGMWSK